jgi:hypothetical protein
MRRPLTTVACLLVASAASCAPTPPPVTTGQGRDPGRDNIIGMIKARPVPPLPPPYPPLLASPPLQMRPPGAAVPAPLARFREAEAQLGRFLASREIVQLAVDPGNPSAGVVGTERFRTMVDSRSRLLLSAQRQYQEVLRLGEPTLAVASAARIGELFYHLAVDLAANPCPTGLNRDQCAFYFAEIRRVTDPLRNKAFEAFAVCERRATQHGVRTPFVSLCRAYLARK